MGPPRESLFARERAPTRMNAFDARGAHDQESDAVRIRRGENGMRRRDFMAFGGIGLGSLLLPGGIARAIAAEDLTTTLDPALKKRLADVALQAARDGGGSYCDVRIGRYLRQYVMTRETRVENVVNEESTGVGIRVIADGAWGFAATNTLTEQGVAEAARQATAIAMANSKVQTAPVQLAPVRGVGEVSWRTPLTKNAMEVPVAEKVDLLLGVNAAAIGAGASFVNSTLFLVNEQKYFASTDGSYIDQDVHRIWAPFTVTAVDKASGKFRTKIGKVTFDTSAVVRGIKEWLTKNVGNVKHEHGARILGAVADARRNK